MKLPSIFNVYKKVTGNTCNMDATWNAKNVPLLFRVSHPTPIPRIALHGRPCGKEVASGRHYPSSMPFRHVDPMNDTERKQTENTVRFFRWMAVSHLIVLNMLAYMSLRTNRFG
jgi:hypothetical protein